MEKLNGVLYLIIEEFETRNRREQSLQEDNHLLQLEIQRLLQLQVNGTSTHENYVSTQTNMEIKSKSPPLPLPPPTTTATTALNMQEFEHMEHHEQYQQQQQQQHQYGNFLEAFQPVDALNDISLAVHQDKITTRELQKMADIIQSILSDIHIKLEEKSFLPYPQTLSSSTATVTTNSGVSDNLLSSLSTQSSTPTAALVTQATIAPS